MKRIETSMKAHNYHKWARFEEDIQRHITPRIYDWFEAGMPDPSAAFTAGIERFVARLVQEGIRYHEEAKKSKKK